MIVYQQDANCHTFFISPMLHRVNPLYCLTVGFG
jgi:hypothetical protein